MKPWTDADALRIYEAVDATFATPRPINRETLRDMLLMVIDETDLPGSGVDIDRATKEEIVAVVASQPAGLPVPTLALNSAGTPAGTTERSWRARSASVETTRGALSS